jgi:hypothetical protein
MNIALPISVLCCGLFLGGCASSGTYVAGTGKTIVPLYVPNQYGQSINLQEATSGPWTAVFFYPKASTPG